LDSLATLKYPAWGYGLMYSFGMFKQTIGEDGGQLEIPDYWLNFGDPWRVQKPMVTHPVGFYGKVENGVWKPGLFIIACANDFLVPGFATDNTIGLRLWSSRPSSELDEEKFRYGDYYEAISLKQRCENLTSVLYPNDNTPEGKEMRLMQEYFMSSATLRDIIRRLKTQQEKNIKDLPEMAAIQLNDTHPAIMVAELLRILIDEEHLPFEEAYEITRKVFSYTCHTLMPEALEKWSVPLFENLLPRHLQIIYDLNQKFLDSVRFEFPDQVDDKILSSLSIVEESSPKQLRMANLAVIGSHTVNGVAAIHSELMKQLVFHNFAELWPGKFQNKTNGVTVRRWLHHCNPGLSQLITETLNDNLWPLGTEGLIRLLPFRNDRDFCYKWNEKKDLCKRKLAEYIKAEVGVELNPDVQMFDVQVKRIHEYKRQTLNVFSIIQRYLSILDMSEAEKVRVTPRACIIGGKSAPGYYAAKKLIKLVNNVARVINSDATVGELLKVVFVPNYNVSVAELIIPGADINQQISTAGTEASGTSNMKFAFNASLIVGTWDGANIEIAEAIGEENIFLFGAKADEVQQLQETANTRPVDPKLKRVFQAIRAGLFGDPQEYECLLWPVEHGDKYLVNVDFQSYLECQAKVDAAYLEHGQWVQKCISSTAGMAPFSSDRTITQYAQEIWKVEPHALPVQPSVEAVDVPDASAPSGSVGSLRRHQQRSIGAAADRVPVKPK
jgi:starch phosphorylase